MPNELKYKKFEDMPSRQMFSPEEIANGDLQQFMEKLNELQPETVETVASSNDVPEGWGVGVIQIAETRDVEETDSDTGIVTKSKKRIPTRVIVWPVPTIAVLQTDAQGMAFVMAAVQKEMAHQIARPFRSSELSAEEAMREAPTSIVDFATRRAAESQFKVFNDLAAAAISMLKEAAGKHPFVKRISKPQLREVLESAASAKAMAPDLEELGLWDQTLDVLIGFAEKAELSSQVFHDWKAKRHNVETLDIGTIDLDGLKLAEVKTETQADGDSAEAQTVTSEDVGSVEEVIGEEAPAEA